MRVYKLSTSRSSAPLGWLFCTLHNASQLVILAILVEWLSCKKWSFLNANYSSTAMRTMSALFSDIFLSLSHMHTMHSSITAPECDKSCEFTVKLPRSSWRLALVICCENENCVEDTSSTSSARIIQLTTKTIDFIQMISVFAWYEVLTVSSLRSELSSGLREHRRLKSKKKRLINLLTLVPINWMTLHKVSRSLSRCYRSMTMTSIRIYPHSTHVEVKTVTTQRLDYHSHSNYQL